jgi:D-alanine-D-alanine ligase
VEFIFPEGESFKHYNMKWVDYDKMNVEVVDDPAIEKRLRDYTTRIFVEFGIRGYARTDFRMGKDGELYMLEINPNCGIFYPPAEPGSADFSLMNDPLGHQGFMDLIIRAGLKRQAEALRIEPPVFVKGELVRHEISRLPTRRASARREAVRRTV